MRRDMDLIRELLLKLEALDVPPGSLTTIYPGEPELSVEGFSSDAVSHHLRMLESGGMLEGPDDGAFSADGALLFWELTWKGRDFIDSVRDPETWAKTKKGALAAGGFTVDLLKDLAKGLIKKQIEERTGIQL